jgi:hypothetical protein
LLLIPATNSATAIFGTAWRSPRPTSPYTPSSAGDFQVPHDDHNELSHQRYDLDGHHLRDFRDYDLRHLFALIAGRWPVLKIIVA